MGRSHRGPPVLTKCQVFTVFGRCRRSQTVDGIGHISSSCLRLVMEMMMGHLLCTLYNIPLLVTHMEAIELGTSCRLPWVDVVRLPATHEWRGLVAVMGPQESGAADQWTYAARATGTGRPLGPRPAAVQGAAAQPAQRGPGAHAAHPPPPEATTLPGAVRLQRVLDDHVGDVDEYLRAQCSQSVACPEVVWRHCSGQVAPPWTAMKPSARVKRQSSIQVHSKTNVQ